MLKLLLISSVFWVFWICFCIGDAKEWAYFYFQKYKLKFTFYAGVPTS